MLRSALTTALFVAASASAQAQTFPPATEYPIVFETAPAGGKTGSARAKAKEIKATRETKTTKARRGRQQAGPSPEVAAMIARHAAANGVPAELAHRIILRESRYNPAARNRSYWGLMQISHATARGIGYRGPAQGLLDPDTNLRFGMAYLGNAYRVAGGDQRRAMKLYASGFYYEAKRKGMAGQMRGPVDASQIATR